MDHDGLVEEVRLADGAWREATPWYRGMVGGLIRAGIGATEKGGK